MRFSVFVGYGSLVVRFFSALLFTVFIVRYMSPEDFSVWVFGFSILPLVSMGYDLWGWAFARRYVLGVKNSLASGILLNLVYMIISSLALYIAAIYLGGSMGSSYSYLALFIINNVFNGLSSIASNLGNLLRPDVSMSSLIIFELSRVSLAYVFVRLLGMGLSGAILSPAIASALSSLYIISVLRRSGLITLQWSGVFGEISVLLRMSVIGSINSVAGFLWNIDRVLMTLVARYGEAVSYLGVAYSLRGIVSQITSVPAIVAYAKLLREEKYLPRDLIYMTLVISAPVLIYSITLSKPLVTLLNPYYVDMYRVVFLVMIDGFLSGLASIFIGILYGVERRDLEARAIRDLMRTSIGRIQIMNLSRASLFALGSLVYSLLIRLDLVCQDPLEVVVVISLLLMILTTSYLVILLREVVSKKSLGVDLREMINIFVSALLSNLFLVATGAWGIEILSITRDLVRVIIPLTASLGIYLIILYALSSWFRGFAKDLVKYLLEKYF